MSFKDIVHLHENHSVIVFGTKGSGKDVLQGNVIARRKIPYCSNCNYGYDFIRFDYKTIVPKVTFKTIVEGRKFEPYIPPIPDGTDIYLSDCGVYFPSQYCAELNKLYPEFPIYEAISRHLSDTRIHANAQHIVRIWDKIREQSDVFVYCNWIFKPLLKLGIAVQLVTIYDKYESAVNRVRPCRVRTPLFANAEARATIDTYKDNFFNIHGTVERKLLIYLNKSKHDSRFFKKMFENGGVNYD